MYRGKYLLAEKIQSALNRYKYIKFCLQTFAMAQLKTRLKKVVVIMYKYFILTLCDKVAFLWLFDTIISNQLFLQSLVVSQV